jgi:aminoglycoside 3-N-acetyltransferase
MSDVATTPARRLAYDKADLVRQLRALGLREQDAVLVRVDFGKMGRLKKPGDRVLVESLLEVIGPRGTLLALTHSPAQWIFQRDRSYVYEPATAPCLTGRFADTCMRWDGAYRSRHPTASMTALGADARAFLSGHDHRAACFAPIQRLIQAGGKMLNIGCTVSSPGFSTVHLVYEQLGLATRSLLSGLIGSYFQNGAAISWFRQRDIPGCSLGFHKFDPLYRRKSVLREGPVGDADAYLIKAADAFQVEREAVAHCPTISLCDSPSCFSCRGTRLFNPGDMARFFLLRAPGKLLGRLARRWRP